jgi:hypothetical protein
MEDNINSAYPEEIKKADAQSEELSGLKDKVNVDQAAIDEAREAVGDDVEKTKS